ncbi:hypothetical protein [Kitasatospora paranensis]|uniref:Uncharacterized protein n=1 Tax=Kitasatospora paranensis TaxID=258053 RepID=A0ABW2FT93_9ACTN
MSDTAVNPPGGPAPLESPAVPPETAAHPVPADADAPSTDVPAETAPLADAPPADAPLADAPVEDAPVEDAPVLEVPPAARRRPSFAVRATAAVVAAALVGVGIGVGILKVRYDDEPVVAAGPTAAAPGPSASPAFGAKSNGTHFGSFRDLLLPVPDGYRLGPDAGAYGNDTELTEAQRKSWMEDEIRGLPTKLQDSLRKVWQDTPLKGGGVRSLAASDDTLVATVWLLQYHQAAVKADDAWVSTLGSDTGLFRLGPQVPGHTEAHCYLPALPPGSEVDSLQCSAALGDLRVVFQVDGVAPLPKDRLVTLFAEQLDRLAIPGATA